jgi:hypothetical protein
MTNLPANVEHVAPVARPSRVGQATTVEQSRAVAEVQAAIVVAQQVPRDVATARTSMHASCQERGLADRAFYRYPRGRQTVQGPSVHLARELARCWGNVQYGIAELRRDDHHGESEMQAWAWDVQTNARSTQTFIVPHKRDKTGGAEKLTDLRDIYENNANMGARRLREAIFSILPPWFVEEAKELCSQTVERGDGRPIEERAQAAVAAFGNLGVSLEQLERKLGRTHDRWTGYDLAQLTITHRSITRGEVQAEDEFPQARVTVDEIARQAAAAPQATARPAEPRAGGASDRETEGGSVDAAGPPPAPATAPAPVPAPDERRMIEGDETADDQVESGLTRHKPPEQFDARKLAQKAGLVFRAEYDDAPRGMKSKVVDRLRYGLTLAITGGDRHSLDTLTDDERIRLWYALEDVQAGRMTYEADPVDDQGGVTFTTAKGSTATAVWTQFEAGPDEATS